MSIALRSIQKYLENNALVTAGTKTLYAQANDTSVIQLVKQLDASGALKKLRYAARLEYEDRKYRPFEAPFFKRGFMRLNEVSTDAFNVYAGLLDGWPLVFEFTTATSKATVKLITNGRVKDVGVFRVTNLAEFDAACKAAEQHEEEEEEQEEEQEEADLFGSARPRNSY